MNVQLSMSVFICLMLFITLRDSVYMHAAYTNGIHSVALLAKDVSTIKAVTRTALIPMYSRGTSERTPDKSIVV